MISQKSFKNLSFLVLLVAVGFFSCGMGEVYEHREELGTLKDQSEDEAAKEKELVAEDANFQNIKIAITQGTLQKETRGKDLALKFGRPSVVSPKDEGQQWFYFAKSKKRLDAPRVTLFFDNEDRLSGWECAHTDC